MRDKEAALATKARAEADDTYNLRCIQGEKVFYEPANRAYVPGQIYSLAGVDEFKISQCCEYHFDLWFEEDDEAIS